MKKDIRKYTQRELLAEGFWSNLAQKSVQGVKNTASLAGRTAKGALAIGKFASEKMAPELYNPIKGVVDSIKDLNKRLIKATTPEATYIENKLKNQGYSLVDNNVYKVKMQPGDEKQLYKVLVKIRPEFISVGESNPQKIFLVDKDGNIVRDLSAKDAVTGGRKPKKKKRKRVLSTSANNPQSTP
jgi:hypothetical protein